MLQDDKRGERGWGARPRHHPLTLFSFSFLLLSLRVALDHFLRRRFMYRVRLAV